MKFIHAKPSSHGAHRMSPSELRIREVERITRLLMNARTRGDLVTVAILEGDRDRAIEVHIHN